MRLWPHCAIYISCVVSHVPTAAQTAPPVPQLPSGGDVGQILRAAEQGLPDAAPSEDAPFLQAPAAPAPQGAQGPAFTIKAFRLEGVSQAGWARSLQQVLNPFVSTQGRLKELHSAAAAISAWYRARGYILARAYVPPQTVSDGMVRIVVEEGYLDPFAPVLVLRSPQARMPRFRKNMAAAIIKGHLDPQKPVQHRAVESALLAVNDMPGVRAEAQFEPGNQAGTTRMVLTVQDKALLSGFAAYDTYGAQLTGRQRFHAGFALQNPSGFGDELRTQVSATRKDYLYGLVNYSAPLGPTGLRLSGSYGYLRYGIGGRWAALQAGGRAQSWNVQARWPLVRQRKQSLALEGGYQSERLRNRLSGNTTSDRTITSWHVGMEAMQAHAFAGGGQLAFALEARQARLDLSALPMILAADQGPWGADMHGAFRTLQWQARLYQSLWPQAKIAFEAQGKGQWANRNLDSAAKFQLGGPEGVRAYPSGEGAGDHGWHARANLHWHWLHNQGPHQQNLRVTAFYDHGQGRPHRLAPGQIPLARQDLSGWGTSMMASWSQNIFLSLHHARALGANPFTDAQGLDSEGSRARARTWLSVSVIV